MKRRAFLGKTASALAASGSLVAALALVRNAEPPHPPPERRRRGLLRPPGSRPDEEDFLSRCIRCLRCSQACEPGAIRLFSQGSGRLSGTPHILPEERACTLCLKCGEVCPTGAIETLSRKDSARMGTAVVDRNLCVSHNGSGICGACFTACPLHGKALAQGKHNAPTIHPDKCVGCGLCEEACIVRGDKAIRVVSPRRYSA